jgi:hypothetical protein
MSDRSGYDGPRGSGSDGVASGGSASEGIDPRRVWLGVAARVWRREPGAVERIAARVLRSPGLARALVITPSLMLAWLIASIAVIGAGAWATAATGTPYIALLAPPMAAAGIAFAYGPGIDPAWELSRSMAVSERTVLIVRALAVFALNALIGVLATLAGSAGAPTAGRSGGTHAVDALTYGWLLPMTAVCLLALAAACVTGSSIAGLVTGLGGWTLAVVGGRAAGGSFATAVSDSAWSIPYLSIALCCGAIALYTLRETRGNR